MLPRFSWGWRRRQILALRFRTRSFPVNYCNGWVQYFQLLQWLGSVLHGNRILPVHEPWHDVRRQDRGPQLEVRAVQAARGKLLMGKKVRSQQE